MTEQEKFIFEIFFRTAWMAAVSRTKGNSRYLINIEPEKCKQEVKDFCRQLVHQSNTITKQQHYKNVEKLNDIGLEVWAAQKVLSVIMKLYWCIGKITKPEVCPIDRIVLRKGCGIKKNWTKITDIDSYEDIMEQVIIKKCDYTDVDLADWELGLWNKVVTNQ